MKARLLKEIRAILPAWVVALLLVTVPFNLFFTGPEWSAQFMWLGLSSGLLAAISFGQEFGNKTIYLMLAQGVSRRRIWYEKMVVLGVALVSVTIAAIIVVWVFLRNHPEFSLRKDDLDLHLIYLMPLCAFCSGPFFTLLSRNMLAGLIFTIATPSLFLGLLFGAISYFLAHEDVAVQEFLQVPGINYLLAVYSIALYYCGCRRLECLESTDAFGQEIKFPRVIENSVAWLTELPGRKWTGPTACLIRKELRLQKMAFLAAGLYGVLVLVFVGIKYSSPRLEESWLIAITFIYIAVLTLVQGAVSTAEERQIGVLESQLALPISARRQWLVKCLTNWLLGLILGLLFPSLAGATLYWLDLVGSPPLQDWTSISMAAAGQMAVLSLAMYASTISQTSVRAMVVAAGLWLAGGWLMETFAAVAQKLLFAEYAIVIPELDQPFWAPIFRGSILAGIIYITSVILRFAHINYRFGDVNRRRLTGHAVWIVALIAIFAIGVMTLDSVKGWSKQ